MRRTGGFTIQVLVVENGYLIDYDLDRGDREEPTRRLIAKTDAELHTLLLQCIEGGMQKAEKLPGAILRSGKVDA